ncbi:hypothetical protein CSE45_3706 [Citreicella sp. SE45]|nr:hypothetical protein CSE45_3706 [Citreicella sp. SE45]
MPEISASGPLWPHAFRSAGPVEARRCAVDVAGNSTRSPPAC